MPNYWHLPCFVLLFCIRNMLLPIVCLERNDWWLVAVRSSTHILYNTTTTISHHQSIHPSIHPTILHHRFTPPRQIVCCQSAGATAATVAAAAAVTLPDTRRWCTYNNHGWDGWLVDGWMVVRFRETDDEHTCPNMRASDFRKFLRICWNWESDTRGKKSRKAGTGCK